MASSPIPAEYNAQLHGSSRTRYNVQDCKEFLNIELARARSYNVRIDDNFKYTFGLPYGVYAREFLDSNHDPEDSSVDKVLFEDKKYIDIDGWQVEDLRSQREDVKQMIIALLDLTEDHAETLSENIVQYATEVYSARKACHKIFRLDFNISLIHYHVLVPKSEEEKAALGVLYDDLIDYIRTADLVPDMSDSIVPPTSDSIKSLKRKRVDEDYCVICLEGREAVSVPCSHLFHGDCIEEWLNISHRCPSCRFKMPTS